jgi:hypothetical protein
MLVHPERAALAHGPSITFLGNLLRRFNKTAGRLGRAPPPPLWIRLSELRLSHTSAPTPAFY